MNMYKYLSSKCLYSRKHYMAQDEDVYSEDMHQLIKIHESMIPLCQTSCLLYKNTYGTFSCFKKFLTVKS